MCSNWRSRLGLDPAGMACLLTERVACNLMRPARTACRRNASSDGGTFRHSSFLRPLTARCPRSFRLHSWSPADTDPMTTKAHLETVKLLAELVGGVVLACVVLLTAAFFFR